MAFCGHEQVDDEIHPSEIRICRRPDGSDWCLGEGNFGKVRQQRPGCAAFGCSLIPLPCGSNASGRRPNRRALQAIELMQH
jgi:hypothetical protein